MGRKSAKKAKRPAPPYPPLSNISFMRGKIARWDKFMFLWGALKVPALRNGGGESGNGYGGRGLYPK